MAVTSEFQVCGVATGKDRRANSVRVVGTFSSGTSDDRRGPTGNMFLDCAVKKTSKSLSWSNRLRQTVPYCRTGNREGSVSKLSSCL